MRDLPSKYDIIPIHTSDMVSYRRCRRYWNWASPTRHNLRRKVTIYGINTNLWYGTGIHHALEQYYSPVLKRDPVEVFSTWFNLQWEGGIIRENELELTYDVNPVELPDGTYRVAGLRDLLPNPVEEEFMGFRDLGIGMMTFYKEYADRHDDFEVVAAESMYSIPLGFEAVDIREHSPNYGKKLEVHARGKRDVVAYWPHTKSFGIIDHKTAGLIDEHKTKLILEKDPQISNYIWSAYMEAELYDLPYKSINGAMYQQLRKVCPQPPTMTTRGLPSLDRQKESTTAKMFSEFIAEHGLTPWFEKDEKARGYYEWLTETGDANFVVRHMVYRNENEIKATGDYLRMVAEEMLDESTRIYPSPSGFNDCLNCAFRAPCIAKDDGSDWQYMINDGYERNRDR